MGKAVPPFHDLYHAPFDQIGGRHIFNALTAQLHAALGDFAALGFEQVGNGTQGGGFTGPVAPQNGCNLAFGKGQRHAFQHQNHMVVDDFNAVDVENDVGIAHGG